MDLNSFILEYRQMLSDFDIDNFKKSQSLILEGTFINANLDKINPEVYFKYIDAAMTNYTSTLENVDMLDKFYSMIYKSAYIDGKNITLPIKDSSSIKKIRPEYMTVISKDYNQNVQRILSNDVNVAMLKSKYMTPLYEDTVKNQIINTTDKMVDLRSFMTSEEPVMVKVDTYYIQHNIIPFLRMYKQIYTDLNKIGNMIKMNISTVYSELNNINTAAFNSVANTNPKNMGLLNTYKFNTLRQFMNICAYTTSMYIRKVSAITYNIMQYMNLYNTIYNYFPEGELILHEAVIDGKISDIGDTELFNSLVEGNFDVIIPHIQAAIGKKKMELSNIVSKKYNYKLYYNDDINSEKHPYDVYSYAALNKTIADIIQNLHTFETNAKDENMIVDEILDKSNLSESFASKYADVLANFMSLEFYNRSKYENEVESFLSLFNDLSHFEKNIRIISINVSKCYVYIKSLVNKYDTNSDKIEVNQYNEIKSVLDQILRNFKDYALIIAKKIIERLDTITDYIDDNEYDNSDWDLPSVEPYIPYDYNLDVELESYDDVESSEDDIMEKLILSYEAAKVLKKRGVKYIFEAEDVSGDNASSGVTGVNNNQTDNNNNSNNNDNNNQTKTDGNGNQPNTVEKFKEILDKIFKKFREAAEGLVKRDANDLQKVINKIDNLDTSNMTLTVAKFERVNTNDLTQDINKVINTISGISGSNIPGQLKGKLRQAETFLTGIPENIPNAVGLKDRMVKYYMNGEDGKNTLRKYSGSEVKEKLNDITNYMSNYNTMKDDITKLLENLKDKAAEVQKNIIDSGKGNETNPEQENQNNNTGDDKKNENAHTGTVITVISKTYAATMCTIMEKKYNEYAKILQAVFPKDTTNMKGKNPNTNETNKDTENK